MSEASGYLCIDWVWGDGDDEFEPIGALNYWETHAVIEALKPHMRLTKNKVKYYKAKGEDNKGTQVLEDASKCATTALDVFTMALDRMRDRYKGMEFDEGNSSAD